MDKSEIAKVFYEIADYLELQGVAFKPQAYRRAAGSIEQLEGDIDAHHREGRLNEIPGIGKAIAEKIGELIDTGRLRYLEKLRSEIPPGLLELLGIPDIGPKTAMTLYRELGIESVEDLKKAIFDHRLQGLKGFGPKSEERILQGIRVVESRAGRISLNEAYAAAYRVIAHMSGKHPNVRISIAGSLRRMKETIGDIDILIASDRHEEIMDSFVSMRDVEEVLAKGGTKSSLRLSNGIQVDLRILSPESYGAALQYFTGSKEHNVELRKLAISKGMKISEYGLFDRDTNERISGEDEADIYARLGLQFIPPELREDRGEILLASRDGIPELVGYDDLRGDLHCHTEWSDASGTIEELQKSARNRGYEYVAITDHSQSLKIASGLSPERLMKQVNAIRKIRESIESPWLLAGSEVDILADGKLDYPDEILRELDFVVASIHSRFKMEPNEMTERIISGISNERVKILAHPTGRIIGQRVPYTFDFERVIEAANDGGVALEINSYPERLDLNDVNVRRALELGATIAVNTDAHEPDQLEYARFGIATARRGWARSSDIINTLTLDSLRAKWGLQ